MFTILPFDKEHIVSKQMLVANKVLRFLKSLNISDVLVAGGAPRNWFLGQPASDIDIFIKTDISPDFLTRKITQEFNVSIVSRSGNQLPPQYRSEHIACVLDIMLDNESVQIIYKNSDEHIFKTFPCSLSMISYEEFCIIPTKTFMDSFSRNTIKFKRDCNQRFERKIRAKYPQMDVVYRERLDVL